MYCVTEATNMKYYVGIVWEGNLLLGAKSVSLSLMKGYTVETNETGSQCVHTHRLPCVHGYHNLLQFAHTQRDSHNY